MKRWIGWFVLFSLTICLLCGCGTASAMDSPSAQPGRDWAEPDAVDDSYTADYDDDADIEGWIRDEFLPAYVERLGSRLLVRLDLLYRNAKHRTRLERDRI